MTVDSWSSASLRILSRWLVVTCPMGRHGTGKASQPKGWDMTRQAMSVVSTHALKTGAQFKASLNDGRQVWVRGRKLNRVADGSGLSAGIDSLASIVDDRFLMGGSLSRTCVRKTAGKPFDDDVNRAIVAQSCRTIPEAASGARNARKLVAFMMRKKGMPAMVGTQPFGVANRTLHADLPGSIADRLPSAQKIRQPAW